MAILAGQPVNVWLIAAIFLVGQYFYQLSFVFYNPMHVDIADASHRSRAYGIGQFASAIGFVVGIAITLPLATSRTAPLLPAVLAFFILALPMVIAFKERKKESGESRTGSIKRETKAFTKKMIAFFAASAATPMLVAFFFFNDALLTLSNNYSIFMERIFSTPDNLKSYLLMAVLVMSAVGGMAAGWVADRIGAAKTLKIILIGWIVAIPLIALAPTFSIFAIFAGISGLLIGSTWTVTRSYLTTILPAEQLGYGFSFYAIAERFATFVGPLAWGGIIWWRGTGGTSYRVAMMAMVLFVIVGLIILMKWKRPLVSSN